jgi:hypothetical protein
MPKVNASMKSFALGLLLLVAASFPANGQTQTDVEKSGLAGRVKSVEFGRVEYVLKDGKSAEGKRIPLQKTTFNDAGNKIEQETFDQSGSPLERLVYTYDAAGRNTGYDEYSSIVDKSLSKPRRHIYTLDVLGRTVEYAVFDSDGTSASRFTYAFVDQGNKTEEAFYSWNGTRTGKLAYTYDEQGHQLTQTSYNADDTLSWKLVNTYDAKGNKTESVQYQGDKLRYRFLYKYDDKGRMTEQETFEFNVTPNVHSSHSPVPGKVTYAYHDERRTKEVATYDERGSLESRVIYAFDDKGNDAGSMAFNPDGSRRNDEIHWYDKNVRVRTLSGTGSVKLDYDAQGNWTRKTYLMKVADAEKSEAYSAEYREITYY